MMDIPKAKVIRIGSEGQSEYDIDNTKEFGLDLIDDELRKELKGGKSNTL